ncbi:MAG: VWA-like domain-containing protein [Bacteroidota bacterium]
MQDTRILESVNRVSARLLISEPFWGTILSSINKSVSTKFAGVSIVLESNISFGFFINPSDWSPMVGGDPYDHKVELLKKQIIHLLKKDFLYRDKKDSPSWQHFKLLSDTEKQIITYKIDRLMRRVAALVDPSHLIGLPSGLSQILINLQKKNTSRVNWKRWLRLFIASGRSTRIKNSISRPSSRYGTTPGIKVKKRHRLLVAIDTSGSVTQAALNQFFAEIHRIWQYGAEILVLEIDNQISNQFYYSGKVPNFVLGKGNTVYDPALQYANDVFHPDAVLYFTDGDGDPPAIKSRYPLLWVISPDGIKLQNKKWQNLPQRKIKISG